MGLGGPTLDRGSPEVGGGDDIFLGGAQGAPRGPVSQHRGRCLFLPTH